MKKHNLIPRLRMAEPFKRIKIKAKINLSNSKRKVIMLKISKYLRKLMSQGLMSTYKQKVLLLELIEILSFSCPISGSLKI
jgi:hypothetical protein